MSRTTAGSEPQKCPHCGDHHPGVCPRVKAIEYRRDGSVKRVEYFWHDEGTTVIDSVIESEDDDDRFDGGFSVN